ncbi:MAG: bifunctional folylpolyglutamate synthase/dihydrofolate synthase [Candidatus Eremiobacteraeota bacterium]|nr:bifunctional folylpolyglutamate synthase/dihydrofolate synthase [Candidatus Eremiobacteraeota bacterium]
MNFTQSLAYLNATMNESLSRRVPYRLERMRTLLRELGDPQNAYPTLHVGGTSGKGSTSTMLATILATSGRRTGLHTKPHLFSVTERARVDGVSIGEERFAELLGEMMPAIDATMPEHGRPSYYETLLALAFLHFAREDVDVAVIEVGVGGKLDGTNVLIPVVSVITNIGLDHIEILGDTLEAIAEDKAGIAKARIPLVSAVADEGPRRIIEARCEEVGARFFPVLDIATIENVASSTTGQSFRVATTAGEYSVETPVLGDFQKTNAATAIVALEQLPDELRPTRDEIESGFARLAISGRMEYFPGFPSVVFDVAHNPDKASHLVASLRETFRDRRFHFVIAVTDTKDAHQILRAFVDLPASFTFTSFSTEGKTATKPQRLASLAQDLGIWGRALPNPVEAFSIARRTADHNDVIVVTGSTFLVSELRAWFMENVIPQETAR